MQVLGETLDFSISDIDSVEESKHIKDKEDGEEMQVDLPKESVLVGGIDLQVPECCWGVGSWSFQDFLAGYWCRLLEVLLGGSGRHVCT